MSRAVIADPLRGAARQRTARPARLHRLATRQRLPGIAHAHSSTMPDQWYSSCPMSEVPQPAASVPSDDAAFQVDGPKKCSRRSLVGALLSGVVPGTGQLLLGQRRKGWIALASLVVLLLCFWPLRVLRF